MPLPIVQVDAFTDRPFAGNPAAVCVLPTAADSRWMLDVAREMNLSETAFLVRQHDGFDLRWFTPAVEIDLCGHATLASAHVLWTDGLLPPDTQARVTSRAAASSYDFVSRFFAPRAGVNEDPVTGSAHCALAPYWTAKLGRTELTGYQASARGGTVRVRLQGDRVILGGQAVTVLRGELTAGNMGDKEAAQK